MTELYRALINYPSKQQNFSHHYSPLFATTRDCSHYSYHSGAIRYYNPRKLFSWQTLYDQTMNNLDFAACETTCVNITYPSADCRHAWPKISITSIMRKFADFSLYIVKCGVGPSFIHLVMSAMFI